MYMSMSISICICVCECVYISISIYIYVYIYIYDHHCLSMCLQNRLVSVHGFSHLVGWPEFNHSKDLGVDA